VDDEMEAELAAAVRSDVRPSTPPWLQHSEAAETNSNSDHDPGSDHEMLHLGCYLLHICATFKTV